MPSEDTVEDTVEVSKSKKSEPIKVRALGRGYFGGLLRERGDVFELASAQEFGVWMEAVDAQSTRQIQHRLDKYKAQGVSAPKPPVDYTKVRPTPATRMK